MIVKNAVDCPAVRCANNKDGGGVALTECLMLYGKMCPFYKTKEQANAELLECIERKAKRYTAKAEQNTCEKD